MDPRQDDDNQFSEMIDLVLCSSTTRNIGDHSAEITLILSVRTPFWLCLAWAYWHGSVLVTSEFCSFLVQVCLYFAYGSQYFLILWGSSLHLHYLISQDYIYIYFMTPYAVTGELHYFSFSNWYNESSQ